MATQTTALTNAEYRKIKAVSKSDLDLVAKSTALIEWSRSAPQEDNDTANIGNAVHCKLLEPELFGGQYVGMPAFDKRTKAGKEQAAQFEESMEDKTLFNAADFDMVNAMSDSVMAHPTARHYLTAPGVSESSIFFEVNGVKCKCRPDRIVSDEHVLVDVKTTDDIDKFAFSIRDYRYDVQDALYTEGYFQLTGVKPRFVFVVVGKRKVFGRHPVRVFELTQEDKDDGRALFLRDLESFKEYEAFGCGLEVETIKMAKRW